MKKLKKTQISTAYGVTLRAAQLAGVDRVTFLLNLHRYDVAMIDLDEDELRSDLENA